MISRLARVGWLALVVAGGCTTIIGLDDEFVLARDGEGGSGGVGVSSSTGSAGGAGGAGGTMVQCYEGKCAEYVTTNWEEDFCDDNPSKATYDALAQCTCDFDMNPATGGKCSTQCANEACAGKEVVSGGECQKCIVDTAAGCGNEFNTCANDF
jgi:hypothetical protein